MPPIFLAKRSSRYDRIFGGTFQHFMNALHDYDDFYMVFNMEGLATLRKHNNYPAPKLEDIMARYRSVTRDKVLERANASKNRGGGSTTVKIPSDFGNMPFFKVTKDVHTLDVIGYVITDTKHPENIEPGYLWHSRRYFSHRNIGAEENSYVCLARTFGQKCPICDFAKNGKNTGTLDKEQLDALRARERMILCVIDKEDNDEKLQLWDVSYHLFGKMLDKELTDSDDDAVWKFFEPDGGISLRCRFSKESFNKGEFWKCDRIDFKDRKKDYPEDILEEVPPLDDILIKLSYEQLEEIFVMGGTSEPEEDRTRSRRGRDSDEKEEAPRGRRGREQEEDAPQERTSRRGKPEPEEEPEPETRASRKRREPEPEDSEPEEKPARRSRKTEPVEDPEPEERPRRSRNKPEPEPEEEPAPRKRRNKEAEQDEEPPARKPRSSTKEESAGGKCPEGLRFGKDCDVDDACDSCKVYGACSGAQRKNR